MSADGIVIATRVVPGGTQRLWKMEANYILRFLLHLKDIDYSTLRRPHKSAGPKWQSFATTDQCSGFLATFTFVYKD